MPAPAISVSCDAPNRASSFRVLESGPLARLLARWTHSGGWVVALCPASVQQGLQHRVTVREVRTMPRPSPRLLRFNRRRRHSSPVMLQVLSFFHHSHYTSCWLGSRETGSDASLCSSGGSKGFLFWSERIERGVKKTGIS